MKKTLILLLVLLMVAAAAGCGNKNEAGTSGTPESAAPEVQESTAPEAEESTAPETEEPAEGEEEGTEGEEPAEPDTQEPETEEPAAPEVNVPEVEQQPETEEPGTETPDEPVESEPEEADPEEGEPESGVSSYLEDIMASLLVDVPNLPMVGSMPLDEENFSFFAFIDPIEGAEGLVSEAMVGSIAHSVVLLALPDDVDAESVAQQMQANADPRKWICVEAEKVMTLTKGNLVLLIMSSVERADVIAANFQA